MPPQAAKTRDRSYDCSFLRMNWREHGWPAVRARFLVGRGTFAPSLRHPGNRPASKGGTEPIRTAKENEI
jgi:hypothetical protein